MNEEPINITDIYKDVIVKILSNLSIRDICGFMTLSKWAQSFDNTTTWHNIMILKGLTEECHALQNQQALLVDELVKMALNKSFCALGMPKNKNFMGIIRNYNSFAEIINHEYGKLYNLVVKLSGSQDEEFVRSYFDTRKVNIYKIFLISTAKFFESIDVSTKESDNCQSVKTFSDDPLMIYVKKKFIKGENAQYVQYGRPETKSEKDDPPIETIYTPSKTGNDLKPALRSFDNINQHKAIATHYKNKYDLCHGLVSPESKLKLVDFDPKIVNNIENLSNDDIKMILKKNPKSLRNINLKSEGLQMYALKKIDKKLPSSKILKYLKESTQNVINAALDKSSDNAEYVKSIDKLFEAFKQKPNIKLFMAIMKHHQVTNDFTIKCVMICPKVLLGIKTPPMDLIFSILEQNMKNIKYVGKDNITNDFINHCRIRRIDMTEILKTYPFVINFLNRIEIVTYATKVPKAIASLIETNNHPHIENIMQFLITECRPLVVETYRKAYDVFDLIDKRFSVMLGLTLTEQDFVQNHKLYIDLEESINCKIQRKILKCNGAKTEKHCEKCGNKLDKLDCIDLTESDVVFICKVCNKVTVDKLGNKDKQSSSNRFGSNVAERKSTKKQSSRAEDPLITALIRKNPKLIVPEKIHEFKRSLKIIEINSKERKLEQQIFVNIIRDAVMKKHPYLLSFMVINRDYPEGFGSSQTYKNIINNAIKKYPAIVEIFENIPEEQQTQAIICAPDSAGNLDVPLSKKAQTMSLILDPYQNLGRIHLDDDILNKSANLNPYDYKHVKNSHLIDVIYQRRIFLAKQLMPDDFLTNKDYISSVKNIDDLAKAGYIIRGNKIHIIKKSLLTEKQLNEIQEANAEFIEKLGGGGNGDFGSSNKSGSAHTMINLLGALSALKQLHHVQSGSIRMASMSTNNNPRRNDSDDSDDDSSMGSHGDKPDCIIQ